MIAVIPHGALYEWPTIRQEPGVSSCCTGLRKKAIFEERLGAHEEFFQPGLVLRRPLYFFNDHHIDERLG